MGVLRLQTCKKDNEQIRKQCCLQLFLSVIATLAVVVSSLLLFAEVSDSQTPQASWSQWSGCTKTCGGGSRLRSRLCPTPGRLLGIIRKHSCWYKGETAEIELCNTRRCYSRLRTGGEDDEEGSG